MAFILSGAGALLLLCGLGGLALLPSAFQQTASGTAAITGAVLLVGGLILIALESMDRRLRDLGIILSGQSTPPAGRNADRADRTAKATERMFQD
jgi:multisubunit Na+/H+ antiporter MnhG subunit